MNANPNPLPRHTFWGAGEPDCPPELKAPNGELHTARCKVCGDGWRKSHDVCLAAREGMPVERIAMLWNSLPLETDPQSVIAFARAIERFHGIGALGVLVGAPAHQISSPEIPDDSPVGVAVGATTHKLAPISPRPACCDHGKTIECCSGGCWHEDELRRSRESWAAAGVPEALPTCRVDVCEWPKCGCKNVRPAPGGVALGVPGTLKDQP